MYLVQRRNDALKINNDLVNGDHADIHITTHGSDVYWAWCALFGLFAILFLAWGMIQPMGRRLFQYMSAFTAFIAAIAYFTMASNLGWTGITVEWVRSDDDVAGNTRQIFYARYIEWFITMALILVQLSLASGTSWQSLLQMTLLAWVMVVCRLIGALISTTYKWGYFTFSTVTYLYIAYTLIMPSRTNAQALGADIGKAFFLPAVLQIFILLLYPIAWGVSEGGNVIAPDSEAVFYSILDMCSIIIIPCLMIFWHRDIEPSRLGIASTLATSTPQAEKAAHQNGHNAA